MFGRKDNGISSAEAIKLVEQALAPANAQLAAAQTMIDNMRKTMEQRATLVGIEQEGRVLRFVFARNGSIYQCECMSTWGDDVPDWKRTLLEPLPGSDAPAS